MRRVSEEPGGRAAVALERAGLRMNAVTSVAGHLSYFGAVFLATPIAVRALGPEGWGIWQLVGALTAYALLLDLGFGTAIHQQVAVQTARGDFESLARAFTALRLYFIGVAVAIVLIALAVGKPIIAAMIEPEHVDLAYATLLVTVVLTALTLPIRLYSSALGGLQRLDLYAAFRLVSALVFFGAIVVGFQQGMGLIAFAVIMTIAPQLAAFPSWFTVRRALPRGSLRFTKLDVPLFLSLTKYSLNTLLYTTGTIVLYQTMKFTASLVCGGAEAAGHMGLSITIIQTLGILFTPAVVALHGRVGQLHGEGRDAEIPALLAKAIGATGLLLVPAAVFIMLEADAIFVAWLGDYLPSHVLGELAATSRYMLIGQALYILALPCYYALLGIGEHRIFGIAMIVTAAINSVAGWLFANAAPVIESIGFVFGMSVAALSVCVTFPAALRRFPIDLPRLAINAIGVPLLVCLPGAFAMSLGPEISHPILALAVDAGFYGLFTLPGVARARRRVR